MSEVPLYLCESEEGRVSHLSPACLSHVSRLSLASLPPVRGPDGRNEINPESQSLHPSCKDRWIYQEAEADDAVNLVLLIDHSIEGLRLRVEG